MSASPFAQHARNHFNDLSQKILGDLRTGEDLVLNLNGEDTLYLRFNENKIRQNTNVEQTVLTLKYQANGRTLERSRTLTLDAATDQKITRELLQICRDDIKAVPVDPHQVAVVNNGESAQDFAGSVPPTAELLLSLTEGAEGCDLAGLYCGGTVVSANKNSKGQSHWFSTNSYFMDYSIYNGPKAVKSVVAGSMWIDDLWRNDVQRAKNQLALLQKPVCDVKPGAHRVYLAPGAVSEILSTMSWGGVSAAAWKQGRNPFQSMAEGSRKLSPLFSLRENFDLGLTPKFNSLGEVAPTHVPLITNGQWNQFLTSTKSAGEYGLRSNFASPDEGLRSPEILGGTLEEKDILKELGTGLYLSNLHYLNWSDMVSARITGMTRYACFWVENGEIVGPIKDLRFDESLFEAFGPKLLAVTKDSVIDPAVGTYFARAIGGKKIPGFLIDRFTFTL